jgi:hypothetical protein
VFARATASKKGVAVDFIAWLRAAMDRGAARVQRRLEVFLLQARHSVVPLGAGGFACLARNVRTDERILQIRRKLLFGDQVAPLFAQISGVLVDGAILDAVCNGQVFPDCDRPIDRH